MRRVSYVAEREALVVELSEPHVFVTTLPHQPREADALVFKRVENACPGRDLGAYYDGIRRELGLGRSIVFLTSADVGDYVYERLEDPEVHVLATVGLEVPTCPGTRRLWEPLRSTVNVAVVVGEGLCEGAMVDLLRVVAEAKTLAMVELLLRCERRSPGTVTDAIAVGRPASLAPEVLVSGMSTKVGGVVAEAVYRRLVEVGMRRLGADGYLYNLVGMRREDLLDLMMGVYAKAPVPGVGADYVRSRLGVLLDAVLSDPNVVSILVAARELDLHASAGSIPGLSPGDYERDSKAVVADELLAVALSLYVSGFRGMLATYWVERLKELGELGPGRPLFEDDVVSALVGSVLTLLYDELLRARPR